MAIDTRDKRASAGPLGRLNLPPLGDGTVSAADRAHLAGLYRGHTIPGPPSPPSGRTGPVYATWESGDDWTGFDLDESAGSVHTRSQHSDLVLAGSWWGRIEGDNADSGARMGIEWQMGLSYLEVQALLRFRDAALTTAQASPGSGGTEIAIFEAERRSAPLAIADLVLWKRTSDSGIFLTARVEDSSGNRAYVGDGVPLGTVASWPSAAIPLRWMLWATDSGSPTFVETRLLSRSGTLLVDYGRAREDPSAGLLDRLYIGVGTLGASDLVDYAVDDLVVRILP